MSEGDRPPKIGGTIISNTDDPSPPQNIYATTTLTRQQIAKVRAKIRAERARLRSKRDAPVFVRAVAWVYKVYSYDLNLESDFVPMPTYGASFVDFSDFVFRKERDAEAEEVVAEEVGEEDER